uniref:Uncharacterized protein n=1 Tax=Solanum tuberosum TaxID=4113 RepID=M1CAJ3_SOLTU
MRTTFLASGLHLPSKFAQEIVTGWNGMLESLGFEKRHQEPECCSVLHHRPTLGLYFQISFSC